MGVDTGFWGQTLSLMDRLGSLEDITENVGYPPALLLLSIPSLPAFSCLD